MSQQQGQLRDQGPPSSEGQHPAQLLPVPVVLASALRSDLVQGLSGHAADLAELAPLPLAQIAWQQQPPPASGGCCWRRRLTAPSCC